MKFVIYTLKYYNIIIDVPFPSTSSRIFSLIHPKMIILNIKKNILSSFGQFNSENFTKS